MCITKDVHLTHVPKDANDLEYIFAFTFVHLADTFIQNDLGYNYLFLSSSEHN